MKIYTGIGSRKTPPDVLKQMTDIAEQLAKSGWLLRSGGADGADLAFEAGADKANGAKEIYLPWKGFNKSASKLYNPTADAFILASTIHPAWDYMNYGPKKLHARNCHQVLGIDLNTPSNLLICWTEGGKEIGGTATAIKLARQHNIPIINLAVETFDLTKYA